MKRLTKTTEKLYFATLLLLLTSAGAYGQKSVSKENIDWKEFVSQEAGFKALFPGEPKFSSQVVMTTPIKRTNNRFEVSLERGYFAVHYSDHPLIPQLEKNDLRSNYNFVENNVAKLTNSEIIKEQDVNLGKLLGREAIFKLKNEAVIVRFYLIDSRLYQNIVSISFPDYEKDKMKDEISKFFNSFSLTGKN